MEIVPIEVARVLPGAQPLEAGEKGVNDTYVGYLKLSDGEKIRAYIKDLDPRQLSNELLAATIARAISLPVPRPFLVAANPNDLGFAKGPAHSNGIDKIGFATEDAGSPPVKQLLRTDSGCTIKLLIKWRKINDLIAFDEWIANTDRHSGNLLIGGEDAIWLIDHGHCFTGPNWRPDQLKPERKFPNKLFDGILGAQMSGAQRDECANRSFEFEQNAQDFDAVLSLEASHVATILEHDDNTALIRFLTERANNIADLVHTRVGKPRLHV